MKVEIHKKAAKAMTRFPGYVQEDILEVCKMLESYPVISADIKKLGDGVYRIRKGGYRILFAVIKERDLILVFEIEARGKISYAKG